MFLNEYSCSHAALLCYSKSPVFSRLQHGPFLLMIIFSHSSASTLLCILVVNTPSAVRVYDRQRILGWSIEIWHLVCRYGAQLAFGLSCSAGAMSFYWWSHRQRPGLDVEQPLVEASGREKDGSQPSLQKVLLAAVCICLGACLCSLCGLGGVTPCNPLLRQNLTWDVHVFGSDHQTLIDPQNYYHLPSMLVLCPASA